MNTPVPITSGQNKEAEFSVLVNQYKDVVYNTALSIVQSHEDAEDITQDVFIRVYQSTDFREESSLSTWIYRVTINASLDHEKKRKRLRRGGGLRAVFFWNEDHEPKEFYHPGIAAENREKGRILFRAIARLPDNQKVAFILQRVEGRAVKEIADITGNTVTAVESLLSRAKLNLKKGLKKLLRNKFKMMFRESEIQKLIEDTLSCADNPSRANCPDTLADKIRTIQAGLRISIWDKAINIFSRPMVAAACVVVVIVADVLLLKDRNAVNSIAVQESQVSPGFATASAALIDSENMQP